MTPSHCKTLKPLNAASPFTLSPILRHTPWSTFKMPNLIIALETGTAPSLDYALPWDPVRQRQNLSGDR